MNPIAAYTRWLHTRWPAGTVEKLPIVNDDGSTSVPGLYITGDLTGIPLLKFSADTGAKAVRRIVENGDFDKHSESDDVLDLAIIGGGVSSSRPPSPSRPSSTSPKPSRSTPTRRT